MNINDQHNVNIKNNEESDNYNDVFKKVRHVLCDNLNKKEEEILYESRFMEDLGFDSLDVVEVVTSIEDMFAISVEDREMESVKTVKNLIELILEKQNTPADAG